MAEYKSPGVYVIEEDAFPPSIVGVQTAVPLFVGYTETAEISGKSVFHRPLRLSSLADFTAIFGGPPMPQFTLTPASQAAHDASFCNAAGTPQYLNLTASGPKPPILATAMRLFFANGGGDCYVISVGDYGQAATGLDAKALQAGVTQAADLSGPTLLVVPEAALLKTPAEFGKLAQTMLAQCGDLQDRFAILDVYATDSIDPAAASLAMDVEDLIDDFRDLLGSASLSYGASYFPFLQTSCVDPAEIDFTAFDNAALRKALSAQAAALFKGDALARADSDIAETGESGLSPEQRRALNGRLLATLPLLAELERAAAAKSAVLPASAAMAGVYAQVDNATGVWNAPANVALASVSAPTVPVDNEMQEDMNVPIDGKAVDAIRSFIGRGILVWGARTLDGNSADWRYIQNRRTAIYIEQSIKTALEPLVFAANDGKTWATAKGMTENFLQSLWSQGGLMGNTASEAFSVECGLGSTMSAQDILDGYMILQVRLALLRPADFMILTFKQQMQTG